MVTEEQRHEMCETVNELVVKCLDDTFSTVKGVEKIGEYCFVYVDGEITLCELKKIAKALGTDPVVGVSEVNKCVELSLHLNENQMLDIMENAKTNNGGNIWRR